MEIRRKDGFSYRYCERAEELLWAGCPPEEIGRHLDPERDISRSEIAAWRQAHAPFDRVFRNGVMDITVELSGRALEISRDGDPSMTKWLLERRAPAFKPKSQIEHSIGQDTLSALLARRVSDEEAQEAGYLMEGEAAPVPMLDVDYEVVRGRQAAPQRR